MRRRLRGLLTIALVMALGTGLGAAPAVGQTADPVFFTIGAAADGRGSVYTIVLNSDDDDSFILQRDATTGEVLARFGDSDGWLDADIAVGRDRRIYVTGNDGVVRVYARGGPTGFRQVAAWPISVPGIDGDADLGEVAPLRGGLLAIATTVDAADPNARPLFFGAVIVDRRGRVVGTWEAPLPSGVPAAGFLAPFSVTAADGEVYVYGLVCSAGGCPDGGFNDGYFYRLELARGARGRITVTTAQQWQVPDFVVQQVTAIDATSFIAVQGVLAGTAGENLAFQVALTDAGLDTTGAVVSRRGRVPEDATVTPARGRTPQALYLVEGTPLGSPVDEAFVQRFRPTEGPDGRTVWVVDGAAWTASWGPEGPPAPSS